MTCLKPLIWYVTELRFNLGLLKPKVLPFLSHYTEYPSKFIFREVKFCLMLMGLKYKKKKVENYSLLFRQSARKLFIFSF